MDRTREIIAIINTCRISGIEVTLHMKDGSKITGNIKESKGDDTSVTILDKDKSAIKDIPFTDISKIEYFGNVFGV